MKMSLASGGPFAIGSAPNTWQHTILTIKNLRLKRTTTDGWISTSCEDAVFTHILDPFPSLAWNRRFNTHVSALFSQNQALREQYEFLWPYKIRKKFIEYLAISET